MAELVKICETVDTEDVVKKALEEFKNNQLIPDYAKHEKNITAVLQEAVQKEAKLTTQMFHMIDNKTMPEVEKEMSEIIGHECVDLIKKSFAIETYRMKVVKKPDGQSAVQVYRKGIAFKPEIMLMTINDIETAIVLQYASLLIEVFLVILNCVGIEVVLSEAELRAIVQELERRLQEMAIQRALNTFVEAWNEAGDSAWEKAKAIFKIVEEVYYFGLLWDIMAMLLKNMLLLEKIRAKGKVVVMIVVAFAINGKTIIARIVLAVDNAVYLEEKIVNIGSFSYMKKTMK